MLPLPDLGALYWYDTHEKLVALVARFVHHIYGQNTGEDPEYVPHSFLLLVSGALRASGSFNFGSESIVAFGTMFLLQRLRYENPKACVPYFASAEDYFVAGMAIAQKYILDISMNNGQLVDATDGQYTITHLRTLERTMLGWLEYKVSMDVKQLEVFVRVTRWFYGDAPLYVMKSGSVVVPVEEGCWPYFGEQLLVPSIQAFFGYNAPRCICTSCAEQYSDFLAALALYSPPPGAPGRHTIFNDGAIYGHGLNAPAASSVPDEVLEHYRVVVRKIHVTVFSSLGSLDGVESRRFVSLGLI
ncbi:hypothetical protein FOMPIDRAFT_98674 [Fomitopsis schrenkii]|uniref:Cyclin N-terminal domain-containing protein n=1 Tax=Fomitopsis schrenkii TaxID=2126942 RepID=S8FE84_FOMSC|nr:hypothetical protein FOMPIDRAFT_98674 [Fomitopsis schrenkii]